MSVHPKLGLSSEEWLSTTQRSQEWGLWRKCAKWWSYHTEIRVHMIPCPESVPNADHMLWVQNFLLKVRMLKSLKFWRQGLCFAGRLFHFFSQVARFSISSGWRGDALNLQENNESEVQKRSHLMMRSYRAIIKVKLILWSKCWVLRRKYHQAQNRKA